MILFGPPASPPTVWAVEDTSAQLTWGDLPPGPVTATAGDARSSVDHGGGPGGLVIGGLAPGRPHRMDLTWSDRGVTERTTLEFATLAPPPGKLLTRFATVNDLHLGATRWGALRTMAEPEPVADAHPTRCARAAITEAVDWGAELLIIKGDAVNHELQADFDLLADLVDSFPDLEMMLVPGNHDVDGEAAAIPTSVGRRALAYTRFVDTRRLPGVQIVCADSTIEGRGRGTLLRVGDEIIDRVAEADRPTFLAMHHQLQPHRIPRHWPAGITGPEAVRFLDRLDGQPLPVMVSSGHTHRNRSRHHGDLLLTEVASTKDWPGVWAGYAVHEGGVRQVVRRIQAPDAISWTEYSRGALFGLWSRWSPGPIDQRCLTGRWKPFQVGRKRQLGEQTGRA